MRRSTTVRRSRLSTTTFPTSTTCFSPSPWRRSTSRCRTAPGPIPASTRRIPPMAGSGPSTIQRISLPRSRVLRRGTPRSTTRCSARTLAAVITSYDPFNKHFMLTTGGTDPTFINIGSEGTTSTGNKVYLSTPGALVPEDSDPEKRKKIDLLLAEFQKAQTDKTQILIVGRPADGYTNPIPDNTHVTGVFPATDQSGPYVTIDQKLQGPLNGTFDFFRPVTDYASTAMYNIWYSWVKYYLDHLPAYTEYTNIINGSVDQDGAYLTFDADRPALTPGMVVAGSGLNGAGNETTPV